jgi:hypothetical protein
MAATLDAHTVDGAAPDVALVAVLCSLGFGRMKLDKSRALDRGWCPGFALVHYGHTMAVDELGFCARLIEHARCLRNEAARHEQSVATQYIYGTPNADRDGWRDQSRFR